MHVRRSFACALALLVLSTGCLETTEDVDVRPDGSLHVEITAKGPVTDLADGYPLPLSGPWRANNAETLAWLRDVGNDTGSAGTRAAAERLPEKGEPLSREGDEVLAVEADFANVRELPALFAPPSEPYASAHFRRSTELSIERKNGRTVYVFERTLQAREFERYDAWSRMQPNLSDALVRKVEQQDALGADGAYFRVHHFARQLGSPFPLLAAVGARTERIEIGTLPDGLVEGARRVKAQFQNLVRIEMGRPVDPPTRRALAMALLGDTLGAEEALTLGLATRVVPEAELDRTAAAMATSLATQATRALGNAKRLIHQSEDNDWMAHLAAEKRSFVTLSGSRDFAEGVAAFITKRKPDFTGE